MSLPLSTDPAPHATPLDIPIPKNAPPAATQVPLPKGLPLPIPNPIVQQAMSVYNGEVTNQNEINNIFADIILAQQAQREEDLSRLLLGRGT